MERGHTEGMGSQRSQRASIYQGQQNHGGTPASRTCFQISDEQAGGPFGCF